MGLDAPAIVNVTRTIWRWWIGELSAVLPEGVRRAFRGWRRELVLDCDGRHLMLGLRRGAEIRPLGEVLFDREDPETAALALRAHLAESDETYDRCVLRLDEGRLLRRSVSLPAAVRGDLAEAVGYDIDRMTPFAPEDVYFGVEDLGIDRQAGQVAACVCVVRRCDLDPLLDALGAAGLLADRIEGIKGGPDLRPPRLPRPRAVLWPRATAALGAAAAALAIAAAILPTARIESRLADLEREVDAARTAALEVDRMRREIATLRERQTALLERKRREPMVIALLGELTRAVPEDAFITTLSYETREITLSGYARKASDVLGAVETAPHFDSARFLSPVTTDRRLERERFSLAARLVARESSVSGGGQAVTAEPSMGASLE